MMGSSCPSVFIRRIFNLFLDIGNPTNLLIDEFSTGIDAKMKRDMWSVLRNVAVGKAVVITTRE